MFGSPATRAGWRGFGGRVGGGEAGDVPSGAGERIVMSESLRGSTAADEEDEEGPLVEAERVGEGETAAAAAC